MSRRTTTQPSKKTSRKSDRLAAIERTVRVIADDLGIEHGGSPLEHELSKNRVNTTRRAALAFVADRLSDRTVEAIARMPENPEWSIGRWIDTIKDLETRARAMDGAK